MPTTVTAIHCRRVARHAPGKLATALLAGLAGLCLADAASAKGEREVKREEFIQSRPAGAPVMAVVSLSRQRVTVYDADGWIMRAPVSSGRTGYETPAGVYSILQRKVEHFSNLYDDAEMPFMQRLTWSGIALHAGALPGYPASHGCVRMPHGFAERFYDVGRLGMRVIVMRDDIGPADISHPALFRPAPGSSDGDSASPSVVAYGADRQPVVTYQNLRRIAAAKAAEAEAASRRLEDVKRAAAVKYKEAAGANKSLRMAQGAKLRAEFHVREIERRLVSSVTAPAVRAELEDAKAKALAKVDEAQTALEAVQVEVQPTLDALAQVREVAQAALQTKTSAEEEAREAKRKMAPISVFISRATQRLYVRQALQPLFESDVTIAAAGERLGTYVFTALAYASDETDLRWNAASLYDSAPSAPLQGRAHNQAGATPAGARQTDVGAAKAALDRISIPADALARISAIVSPGSALIISDEPLSRETGQATEFVVVMSGEPQGGIKIRRRDPAGRGRYERFMRRSPYGMGPSFW
jgi:hypothetical protein